MMKVLIISLILLAICMGVLIKYIKDLTKLIVEIGNKIDDLQYQIDDVLHDINIVNENVLNNYGLLGEIINKENNYKNHGR